MCMRIEDVKGSSVAVRMSGKHVIPKLLELGYIKSFEVPGEKRNLSSANPAVNNVESNENVEDSLIR